MITSEQVPENVWVQVALRLESVGCLIPNSVAKLIVAEAINAWTGMQHEGPSGGGISQEPLQPPRIILPLPTEASDE